MRHAQDADDADSKSFSDRTDCIQARRFVHAVIRSGVGVGLGRGG
jgi:hypothetical protein